MLAGDLAILGIVLEGDLGNLGIVLAGNLDLNSCLFYYCQTDQVGNNVFNLLPTYPTLHCIPISLIKEVILVFLENEHRLPKSTIFT